MKKFIEAAKLFRTPQYLACGFTKAETREGLKRYIHLKYIEWTEPPKTI